MTMLMHHMLRAAAGYAAPTPPSTDAQFNYVTMLLHGDGTNGAQNNTFVDSSTNNFTLTRTGTPTQGSFSPYGDLWGNYFSGSTQYLTVATNAAFTYGTGDFTIEGWAQLGKIGAIQYLVDQRNSGTASAVIPAIYVSAGNVLTYYVSGAAQITGTTALAAGAWFHFAVCRSGTSTKLFLNGVQEGSTYSDTNNYAASRVVLASQASSATSFLQGCLSNVRLVKGTALYTSTFTPSTTPLTAVSGTSLLTCQSNRFRDNSSNNFAFVVTGTPSVQRFSPFDPAAAYSTSVIGGSGVFSGSAQYLSASANAAYAFGTGDFTVEYWVNASSWSTSPTIFDTRTLNTSTTGYSDFFTSAGRFSLFLNNAIIYTSAASVPVGTWAHIAISRQGTSLRVFINGVQDGATVTNSTNMTDQNCLVAVNRGNAGGIGTGTLNGYLSNFRIVKGTAVYTANFTPPTAPLTAITNTSLLLNTVNAGIFDNAMMNDLVTVGDAQISTAVVKYGTGSLKFDGTGDYLTSIDTPNLQFGTGDFTIESWVYMTTVSYECGIVSKGASSTGWSFGVNASATNRLFFLYGTSNLLFTNGIPQNTWTHVALTRSGSTVRAFINGVQDATTGTISTSIDDTSILRVGEVKSGTRPLNGYIDDLRITKGYARYTANFTPPTAAFPNN